MDNKKYIKNLLKCAGSMLIEPKNLLILGVLAEIIALPIIVSRSVSKQNNKKVDAEKVIKQLDEQKKKNKNILSVKFTRQR